MALRECQRFNLGHKVAYVIFFYEYCTIFCKHKSKQMALNDSRGVILFIIKELVRLL